MRSVYFQLLLHVDIPALSYTYSHRFWLLHSWTVILQNLLTRLLDSDPGGPPQNIRAWLKFVAICCQVRYVIACTLCHTKVDPVWWQHEISDGWLVTWNFLLSWLCVNGYMLGCLKWIWMVLFFLWSLSLIWFFFLRKHTIFSTSEAEELIEVVICLFLDRQLQGLSMLFNECMLSVISCFTEKEWHCSCEKVAKSLACR